jgi:hypothetical protein
LQLIARPSRTVGVQGEVRRGRAFVFADGLVVGLLLTLRHRPRRLCNTSSN